MSDTATFRGSGGAEWTFDLPMAEVFRNQIAKGDLKPVDDAAKAYAESLQETGRMRQPDREPEPEREQIDVTNIEDPEPRTVDGPLARPPEAGPGSSRRAWADYAVEQGIPVEDDDTRDDIIAKLA